jgi:hypothetical protein
VDDILKRLGNVETAVGDLRVQVGVMVGTIPHLATAASVADLKKDVCAIAATIPHLATAVALSAMETRIIKWMVATGMASTGLACTLAKFVH